MLLHIEMCLEKECVPSLVETSNDGSLQIWHDTLKVSMEADEYGVVILLLETKNYFSKISLFHSVLIASTDTNLICLAAKPS